MRNIKLTIEYDGRRYLGWQRLSNSDKTIQGKIESVIFQMTDEKIEIIGSGRTDAGTHARAQVANFKTNSKMSLMEMRDYLNRYLPNDIVIKQVEEVPERFHSRYNVLGKQYSYYVWTGQVPNVFEAAHSFHYEKPLDLELISEACEKLVGQHDFIGFSSLKKTKKSTVRELSKVSVTKDGDMLHFKFEGEGFLYKMVRILVGTLLEIGDGTLPVEIVDEVFERKIRQEAGVTVPSHGLFLDEVYYKN